MKGSSPVFRRLIAVSAAVLGVGLVATGCSAVKVGSAAIVGNQRITVATLDTEVTNLSENVKQYHNPGSLSVVQQTQDPLTWLIRFQINEQLARTEGITVSTAQAQAALAEVYAEAKSELESEGVSDVTLNYILSYIGIPPNLAPEVGRYQAIETQYVEQVNGGKIPTSTAAQTATTAKLQQAQCVAAKTLQIQVNPQFGRLNYSQFAVVTVPSTVAAPPGPAKAASTSGLTPAC
jgi:SurA N-terminal domain